MSNVTPFPSTRTPPPPTNVEAEAAFLGALMRDNSLLARLPITLAPDDFFEPVHARVMAQALEMIAAGKAANPITLRPHFAADEAMKQLGGPGYLARLTGDPAGDLERHAFADHIAELAERRRRMDWASRELAAACDIHQPLVEAVPPPTVGRSGKPLQPLDLLALAEREPQPKAFIVPRLFPAGEVSLFTGAGAVGKSLLAQQVATALAAGASTLGLCLDQAPAVYLTCEDDADQLHWRQAHICRALGINLADLAGTLHLVCLRGEPDNAIAIADGLGQVLAGPLFARLAALLRSTGAQLAFLDNVAHLVAVNENDRGEVTRALNLLNRLAGETGAAIVLLGHPNKGGDTYSGSTGWLNAVRSQVTMERPKDAEHDADLRSISVGKPNYAQAGEALRCRWSDWAFTRYEDLPENKRDELSRVIAASGANEAFLSCLRERSAQGEGRAVGPNSGPNFAPAQFQDMPAAKGYNRDALRAAMERLFALGKIESVVVRNKAKGRDVTIIREVQFGSPNASRTPSGAIGAQGDVEDETGAFLRVTGTPNASPNDSRTLVPNAPEHRPNTPRTIPERTPPPTGEGVGEPGGPHHPAPQEGRRQP